MLTSERSGRVIRGQVGLCKQAGIVSVEDPCVVCRTDLSHLKDHKQHSARSSLCSGTTAAVRIISLLYY
jgi:hypothetical protein